ncbi:MAG: hypothetical protein DMG38_04580 [Acidobacteria bacterium]|nr:MAG: hypothetical protein DMG38_04580 [Acidobacteriota bacterium]
MIKEPPNVVELPMSERGLMALKVAFKKAIEEYARAGLRIYVWRDGKVVEIPSDELRAQLILLGAESK